MSYAQSTLLPASGRDFSARELEALRYDDSERLPCIAHAARVAIASIEASGTQRPPVVHPAR